MIRGRNPVQGEDKDKEEDEEHLPLESVPD
jgi:hypothetical protein